MKRLILLGLLLAPTVGCMTFKPVGPLLGKNQPTRSADQPNAIVTTPKDIGSMPMFEDAPPPPAPTRSITVGDVQPGSGYDAAKKLKQECEADIKAAGNTPNYVEVSHVPRGGR